MRILVLEGTPEEIAKALPQLSKDVAIRLPVDAGKPDEMGLPDGDVRYVDVTLARTVLSRRRLSKKQKIVLETLYKAHPTKVLATELQKRTATTSPQFRGLMGAFGRRLTYTKGYVDPTWLFVQEWDSEQACYAYTLPDSVREAMRLLKLV